MRQLPICLECQTIAMEASRERTVEKPREREKVEMIRYGVGSGSGFEVWSAT